MIRNPYFHTAFAIAATLTASPAGTEGVSVVDELVKSLSVSPEQATGGATAMLDVARANLSGADLSALIKAVPSFGTLLGGASGAAKEGAEMGAEAPKAAASEGEQAAQSTGGSAEAPQGVASGKTEDTASAAETLMAAAGSAGIDAASVAKLAASNPELVASFAKLGLDSGMVTKFAPVLMKHAVSTGGGLAGQLFAKGLGK